MSTFNFDTPKKKFDLIPEGIYDAKIEGTEERVSKSGNKYKRITFQLFGEKAEKEKMGGRLIWDNLVLLEQVEWKIQNLLYACGLPYEGSVTLSDDWKELSGKTLKLGIGTREYQDKKFNDIKNYYAGTIRVQPDIPGENLEEEDIPVIEEEETKKSPLKKKLGKSKTSANKNKESDKEEINIDDIPF